MFDPEAFGAEMGELIRAAVEPLEKRVHELEAELKKARDVDETLIAHRIEEQVRMSLAPVVQKMAEDATVEYLAEHPAPAGADGAPGKDGVSGVDGKPGADGKSLSVDDVRPMLEEAIKSMRAEATETLRAAVKEIPLPKDGAPGKDGANGVDGQKGADGLGLAGAMIDREGALQITLTNGEVKSLGLVVGKDGNDGLSLDGFELEYLPESHEIAVKAMAAGRVKELRYPAGGIRPAGYWREGTKAQPGEAWVHDGSTWFAKKTTSSKPESRSEDWIIAARKGRDGETVVKTINAGPPAPIKLQG